MPGLTLSLSVSDRTVDLLPAFRQAQASMLHAPDYEQSLAFAAGGLLIGHVGYPGYPVLTFERDGFFFAVEGHVYNKQLEALKQELADLASEVYGGPKGIDSVRRWVESADGDFVVVAADPKGEGVFAFTDALGRLPLYFFHNDQQLIVSRECKFVAASLGTFAFDRLGWAQSLWIGYPLGHRTLMRGVERGGCGLFVQAATRESRLQVVRRELVAWDFGSNSRGAQPVRALAADLVDLFGTAIRQRGELEAGCPRVVSLSGGHDSRSVAAGLRRFNGEYRAISRQIIGRPNEDWKTAEIIARELRVPWDLIEIGEAGSDEEARLVWLKDGLNYVGTAFMIEYMERIVARHGRRTVYVTGDGGDKIFPDLRPWKRATTSDGLIRRLIEMHTLRDAGTIEGMMGLESGTLEEDLRSSVKGYPEQDAASKAIHFSILERTRKWLFEGEDRNRCFLWQSSPCYALPVFGYAMGIPASLKRDLKLYRSFQEQLWPSLTRIAHADVGFPIASSRFRFKTRSQRWLRTLPRSVKGLARAVARRKRRDDRGDAAATRARVVAQWQHSGRLQTLMNEHGLRAFLGLATRRNLADISTLALLSAQWETRLEGG
jgi:asparagine synthase (glutamine-hydrolysing)